MEQQVTEVEQEVITTFKKASEFRHWPIHYIQLHRYTIAYALKPFFGMVAYSEVGWTEEDTSKTHSTL